MMNNDNIIQKELHQAIAQYKLALQQEDNANDEYVDIAIHATNAAATNLDNIIKKAKLAGYNMNLHNSLIHSVTKHTNM